MGPVVKTALASIALLAAATTAQAGDSYPIYSGAGFSQAIGVGRPSGSSAVFASVMGWNPGPANLAPVGTFANPMPVHGPVTLFRLRTGEYRIIPRY